MLGLENTGILTRPYWPNQDKMVTMIMVLTTLFSHDDDGDDDDDYDDDQERLKTPQCTLEWSFRAAVQGDTAEAFFMSYLSLS